LERLALKPPVNTKEKAIILISNQPLEKADAIVVLESIQGGEFIYRLRHAASLYRRKWSNKVVISGGVEHPEFGKRPWIGFENILVNLGVEKKDILIEKTSKNTQEQASRVIEIVKRKKLKSIILVASHYHQYRAFLTFLKEIDRCGLKIKIINSPARNLKGDFSLESKNFLTLIDLEFNKIESYKNKFGSIAEYAKVLTYFQSLHNNKKIKMVKKLFSKNFIGPEQLVSISNSLGINVDIINKNVTPDIPWSIRTLKRYSKDYVLILGIPEGKSGKPLTINYMRDYFGIEPNKKEPCLYNQDWYIKEKFASKNTLEYKWYLIKKEIIEKTRAKDPEEIIRKDSEIVFPSAVLTTYTFFAYYFLNKVYLWKNDYIWCSDMDHNGFRIYTGRYFDSDKVNKNGFNIHRYLKMTKRYAVLDIKK
jgi:uncharacterized SAM-binding protein YcdF (DUF218 family)